MQINGDRAKSITLSAIAFVKRFERPGRDFLPKEPEGEGETGKTGKHVHTKKIERVSVWFCLFCIGSGYEPFLRLAY